MPVERLVSILLCVVLAAGLTIGAAALLGGMMEMPGIWPVLVPLALAAAILLRVVVQRHGTPPDEERRR